METIKPYEEFPLFDDFLRNPGECCDLRPGRGHTFRLREYHGNALFVLLHRRRDSCYETELCRLLLYGKWCAFGKGKVGSSPFQAGRSETGLSQRHVVKICCLIF